MSATFHPNPNEETEPWIERAALKGSIFRIWHLMFFCFVAFLTLMIMVCCCLRIRIPRTKQEIEADYRRKKLAEKFRERLRLIPNQEMDEIDLKCALEIIQEDYKTENRNITEKFSVQNYSLAPFENTSNMAAEPQQPIRTPSTSGLGFAGRIATLIGSNKNRGQQSSAC